MESSLFRDRDFSLVAAAVGVSALGDWVAIVALGLIQSPEGRKIFPRLTVLENLQMGAYTRGDPAEVARWIVQGTRCPSTTTSNGPRTRNCMTCSGHGDRTGPSARLHDSAGCDRQIAVRGDSRDNSNQLFVDETQSYRRAATLTDPTAERNRSVVAV